MALENEEQVCCGADCLTLSCVRVELKYNEGRRSDAWCDKHQVRLPAGGENYTDDLEGEYVKETQLKLAAEIKNQTNLSLANSIHW